MVIMPLLIKAAGAAPIEARRRSTLRRLWAAPFDSGVFEEVALALRTLEQVRIPGARKEV